MRHTIRSVSAAAGLSLAVFVGALSATTTILAPAQLQQPELPVGTPTQPLPDDAGYIVDDGDPGYYAQRVLERKVGAGYGADYQYVARARWSFYNIPAGEYEVLTTWQSAQRNARDVVYTLYDINAGGRNGPAEYRHRFASIDQRQDPDGAPERSARWENMGRIQIEAGDEVRVYARDNAWLFPTPALADAVWLRPIRPAACGNGVMERNEQCDDGNQIDTDSCSNICVRAQCGDGICQAHERDVICASDHGVASDHDGCVASCPADCAGIADGLRAVPLEQFNVDANIPSGGTGHALSFDLQPADNSDALSEQVEIRRLLFTVEGESEFVHHLNIVRQKQIVGRAVPGVCAISGLETAPNVYCVEFRNGELVVPMHPENPFAFYMVSVDAQVIREGVELGASIQVAMEDGEGISGPQFAVIGVGQTTGSDVPVVTPRIEGGLLTIEDSRVDLCGNGIVESNEQCDDGNRGSGDGCSNICLYETSPSDCNNNAVCDTNEACNCGDCQGEQSGCPNGFVCGATSCVPRGTDECENVVCEPGKVLNQADCECVTVPPLCGNDVCDEGEDSILCVDPGPGVDPTSGNYGCFPVCEQDCGHSSAPVCGNSIQEQGEECDDGNSSNDDTCTHQCKWANDSSSASSQSSSIATCNLRGDVNGDSVVNEADLAILVVNFNRIGVVRAMGDVNGDGTVNVADLIILTGEFGRSCPLPGSGSSLLSL